MRLLRRFWDIACLAFTPRMRNPSKGAREYTEKHWGDDGKGGVTSLLFPNVHAGPLVELGQLVRIEYLTKKGKEKAVFFHDFEGTKPRLVFNADGKLLIGGGSYIVKEEGIVG